MAVSCSTADGGLARIVEAKDAGPEELAIGLCNGGIMAIDARHAFDLIDQIGNDNAKREFYLTDIVGIAKRRRACAAASSNRPRRRCSASTPAPNWPRPRR